MCNNVQRLREQEVNAFTVHTEDNEIAVAANSDAVFEINKILHSTDVVENNK